MNNQINNNLNDNPYKNYLPKNRVENEGGLFSPRILKTGLYVFYFIVFLIICGIVLHFKGYDILKSDVRSYNMNLAETIDLDAIYKSSDVEWVSTNNNVVVKNNVVTALKSGNAYLYAKVGNKQVTDVSLNILNGSEAVNILNHSINLSMSSKDKILVNKNRLFTGSKKYDNFLAEMLSKIMSFYKRIIGIENKSNNKNISNDANNPNNNKNNANNSNNTINPNSSNNSNNSNGNNSLNSNSVSSNVVTNSGETDEWVEITDDDYDSDGSNIDEKSDEEYVTIDYENDEGDDGITYSSSDESVATVDDEGNVTPVNPGVVEIIAEDEDGNKDYSVVTVKEDMLDFSTDKYSLNLGDSTYVEYSFDSIKYSNSDINWSSSDENIVSVSDDGEINGIGLGTAVVTAEVGKIRKEIEVEVIEDAVLPTDINLSSDNVSVYVGENVELNASVNPGNVVDDTLSWLSENDLIATVGNGIIVGKSVGTTIVKVTTVNGISKEVKVEVKRRDIPVDSIMLSDNNINMKMGDSYKLNYTVMPANATDKDVKISYDQNKLMIDDDGNIKALKSGVAKVEIVSNNGKSAVLNINISPAEIKLEAIKLNVNSLKMLKGDNYSLIASVNPGNATDKTIKWNSSDSNVVSVDNKGNLTAVNNGKAIVSVESVNNPNIIDKCEIVVSESVIQVKKLIIDQSKLSMIVGDVKKLSVSIEPTNATDKNIEWSSSNRKIADIDKNGNVIAVSEGVATITAVSKANPKIKVSSEISISKKEVEIQKITMKKKDINLEMGSSEQLSVSIEPLEANIKDIKWISSNDKIVKVDNNGKVTSIGVGDAVITAISDKNGSVLDSCNVKVVVSVKSIKLNSNKVTLKLNDTFKFSTVITPKDVTDNSIKWNTSNEKVVTVDENGKILAVGGGTATVSATSVSNPKVKSSSEVKVIVPVTGLKLNSSNISLYEKETFTLVPTIIPSLASDKSVIWKSENVKIATVSNKGVVKAISAGKTKIIATSSNNSLAKAEVVVNVARVVKKVKKIVLGKVPKKMSYGKTYNLNAKVSPADATNKKLLYTSSNPAILKISDSGKIQIVGNSEKNVKVVVRSADNTKVKASFNVDVKYGGLKKLGIIRSNGSLVSLSGGVSEGLCVLRYKDDKYIYSSKIGGEIVVYKLKKVDGKNKYVLINSFKSSSFGHANDMACDSEKNRIYVTDGNKKIRYFGVKDSLNGKVTVHTIKTKYAHKTKDISGIAYDIKNNSIYLAKGGHLFIANSNLKVSSLIYKIDSDIPQGIGGYNGKILVVRFNKNVKDSDSTLKKPRNAIDVYDQTGRYLGTNILKLGSVELESVDYYGDGYFAVQYYNPSGKNKVVKVKLNGVI